MNPMNPYSLDSELENHDASESEVAEVASESFSRRTMLKTGAGALIGGSAAAVLGGGAGRPSIRNGI